MTAEQRRAEEGQITDQKLEWLRQRIGIPAREVRTASYEYASVDAIRNFARGTGDVNEFYRNPEYARRTRWGTPVAPPPFMLHMGIQEPHEYTEDEIARGALRGDPLAGVHGFYTGEEIEWFRHIEPGDRLTVRGGLASVDVKSSAMAGRSVYANSEHVYRNQRGEVVGLSRQSVVRMERARARSGSKYEGLDVPHRYSDDELAQIDAAYEVEHIQGATPRYWEDVQVGDESGPLVKGPWTVTAYICYCEATGPRNEFHRAHSDAYRYRKQHPRAFPPTDYGLPDTVARVHWDLEMARQAGVPHTYDYGGERVAMISHFATNWMGDDGFLRRLKVQIRGFLFYGDTMWIRGLVTAKRVEAGEHLVSQDIWGENQRGERITLASADYILPSRADGPVGLPARIPDDLSPFL